MWQKGALPKPCPGKSCVVPQKLQDPKKRRQITAAPGFKSQCQSSSVAPFPAPLTIGHSCQHSKQVWPCGVEPIISKLFWTPLQIPIWGPPLAAPCYRYIHSCLIIELFARMSKLLPEYIDFEKFSDPSSEVIY